MSGNIVQLASLKAKSEFQLSVCQSKGLDALGGSANIFITGGAGVGKSTLINAYKSKRNDLVMLSSTGSAAILVGGRTFHSFFGIGLGSSQGGAEAALERGLMNPRVRDRIRGSSTIIIDEISMIKGADFSVAEKLCRMLVDKSKAWGGIKIIVIGDFLQLPPVPDSNNKIDWVFESSAWIKSDFVNVNLTTIMRSNNHDFNNVLNKIRIGVFDESVEALFERRTIPLSTQLQATRLFAKRSEVETYNEGQLAKLSGRVVEFETKYSGNAKHVEKLKKEAPIPEVIRLKIGALVMLRTNDPNGLWVNGSQGIIKAILSNQVIIELLNGSTVFLDEFNFRKFDDDGDEVASALNFPINLAWAYTIHKAQGTTLDRVVLNASDLWAPGQFYVAVSRVRSPESLFISQWSQSSIRTDPLVLNFYKQLTHSEIGY